MTDKKLLFIIEQGGYHVYADRLTAAGYAVTTATSMRKALALLKTLRPTVVIAEFNRAMRVNDRISNLEPLLAQLQSGHADTRLVVLLERQNATQLQSLQARFPVTATLYFPFEAEQLLAAVASADAPTRP